MKRTPFYNHHLVEGAKMLPFAGYEMPISYSGINEEHLAVRTTAGLFDVSHMGEFLVSGQQALPFLQYLTTNDVRELFVGKAQYTCFPNGRGGLVDDLLIYRVSEEEYLLVVNAANKEKDWRWCLQHAGTFGISIGNGLVDQSDQTAQLSVQGPLALKCLEPLVDADIMNMASYTCGYVTLAGVEQVLLAISGYTGSGGCEIYFPVQHADRLWPEVLRAVKSVGGLPVGLGARDTLRLEMGYSLYGQEIDDTTSPVEAGLVWICRFVEGNEFIDRAVYEKQRASGVNRKLAGLALVDRGVPRHGYQVVNESGRVIGQITSGTMSPVKKTGIGMAYVEPSYAAIGTTVYVVIREKPVQAKIVKLPFI